MKKLNLKYSILLILGLPLMALCQTDAYFEEEWVDLKTYPYSDPNPRPVLNSPRDRVIYPYHLFQGFTTKPVNKKWKLLRLENDFIVVWVAPELGGKIWGAMEKQSGKEFIYRNDVVKFRDVALRGPWTSGGVEFNFGIIGHSPATAGAVDYLLRKNDDGSVSCIVGSLDLPSRTPWRVEIRLPKDKAYFETHSTWYNATPLPDSYYCFLTGAAAVSDDLEFFYPGNQALEHSGESRGWPIRDGHNKAWYRNNAYGSHTSIHVVGEYQDFFGGYFHNQQFGFGHWSLYGDMPGRKLWLWASSREGAIWEDLLTDKRGQYMEFQAGRSFNQYSPGVRTPMRELPFQPGITDQWREIWFPVIGTGGMKEVSPYGVLNIVENGNKKILKLQSFDQRTTRLQIRQAGNLLLSENVNLQPLQVFEKDISTFHTPGIEIELSGMELTYTDSNKNTIDRPFVTNVKIDSTSASEAYQQGIELRERRQYEKARSWFLLSLERDAFHLDAMTALAELYYRSARYDSAIWMAKKVLSLDAYHAGANYIAGLSYRANADAVNAMETLGWAARSAEYRAAANAQMASIALHHNENSLVQIYAHRALDYNRNNLDALATLAILYREQDQQALAADILAKISAIDPLCHFVYFERWISDTANKYRRGQFLASVKGEFPDQSYLELALQYFNRGRNAEAMMVLQQAPPFYLGNLWLAYLQNDTAMLVQLLDDSVEMVFPYRLETLLPLRWAAGKKTHWKTNYLLALNLWALGRSEESKKLLLAIGEASDFSVLYYCRASLVTDDPDQQLADLEKAFQLAPHDWRNAESLVEALERRQEWPKALELSAKAFQRFTGNYNIAVLHARIQLKSGLYRECLKTLAGTKVLPFEGSIQGKFIYEQAYMLLALAQMERRSYKAALRLLELSKAWPENLGAGAPYDPDNRLQQYLQALCHDALGHPEQARILRDSIVAFTNEFYQSEYRPSLNNLLAFRIFNQRADREAALKLAHKLESIPGSSQVAAYQRALAEYRHDDTARASWDAALAGDIYVDIIQKLIALESREMFRKISK